MTPVLHSKSMEYWHLPAKGFTSLLDSNLPSIYTQKLIPVPYTQKASQARTASSYELSLHCGTAACESCPLKASSSLAGSRDFPPYRGNDSILNLSKESRDYLCQEDKFFVAGKVLTWFNSPLNWQKTNLRRKKKKKSNFLPDSWAKSAHQRWHQHCCEDKGRTELEAKKRQQDCPSWHQLQGSAVSPNCIFNPRHHTQVSTR